MSWSNDSSFHHIILIYPFSSNFVVWYHVLSGRKRFYLVPPSCANLAAYARWTTDSTAEEVFFGDYVQAIHDQAVKAAHKAGDNEAKSQPQVFRLDLLPGQTLFIPGAWIHAVFTPEDSLVFGGNFLHSAAVLRQLQVHQIEQRTRVGKQYRFPYFKELHAYVLCRLLPVMRRAAQRPQQELAAWMEDESDEDLASMAAALLSHDTLLRQFPYLVRACEVWASPDASGKAAAAEAALLAKVAKECIAEYDDDGSNFDSLASIIAEWWRLLEELASARDASGATQSGSLSSFTLHVRRIRAACPERMDFLDSAFLRGGLSYQGKSLQSWPDPSLDAAVLGNWDQFGQPLSAMPTSSPSAALKLRLGRGSPAAIVETDQRNWVCCDQCGKWRSLPATVDVQGLPEQWTCAMNVDRSRNTCDADEESDAQQQQRLLEQPVVQWVQCSQCEKWRTVAPTVDAAALPDDWRCANNDWDLTYSVCEAPEEAVPNASTGTATTPIADQPPLKLSLKRKAPQSPDDAAAAEAETGSARKRKIHLTFAVKTKRKAAEDNDPHLYTKTYESRVVNAADSRTRGRKLSAKFLQDSADAEVSADEEEDDGLLEGAWKLPAENVDPVMFARMKAAAVRQGVALDTLVPGTILTKEGEIMAAAKPRARPSKPAVRFDDSEDDVDYQDEAMADGAVAEEGPAVTEADFEMSDDSSDVNEDSGDEDYGLEEVSDDGLEVLDVQEEAKGTDRSRTRAKIPKGARADKEAEKGPKTAWSVPKFAPGQSVSSNIGSSSSSGDMPSLAALVGRSAAAAATSGPRAPPAPAATAPLMYAGAPVQAAPRQMQSSSLSLAQRKPVPTKKFPSREALLKKIGMRR